MYIFMGLSLLGRVSESPVEPRGGKGGCGFSVAEVKVAVALNRSWPCRDVKGDLEQWEDLSKGSGSPLKDRGPCGDKTRMGDICLP